MCRFPEVPVSLILYFQLRVNSKKQLLKFISQLFCKRRFCPRLTYFFLLLATLGFFWCYFETLRSLVLSVVKLAVNLNTAVTLIALISPGQGPLLSALWRCWPPGKQQEWCKAFKNDTRQELREQDFGLRQGASSLRHSFFLHQVRGAESCVGASLLLTVSADSQWSCIHSNWVVTGVQIRWWLAQINKNLQSTLGENKLSYLWVWFSLPFLHTPTFFLPTLFSPSPFSFFLPFSIFFSLSFPFLSFPSPLFSFFFVFFFNISIHLK